MQVTVYHNPSCGKSRATLDLLQKKQLELGIVEYLKHPPSTEEIHQILQRLNLEPRDLMRKNAALYRDLELDDEMLGRQALIAAIADHPVLMQRPIVLANGKAAIGRPPEQVLGIL